MTILDELRDLVSRVSGHERLSIDHEGGLRGTGVREAMAHRSWYGGRLVGGAPRGAIVHYTATAPGTAESMARRRMRPRRPDDRATSWHVTVDHTGLIWQHVPFTHRAWHAGGSGALVVPELGLAANSCTLGIELEGLGEDWPEAQVAAAARLWHCLVSRYRWPRATAMVPHARINPTRKARCPGAAWMTHHASRVLELVYGSGAGSPPPS
jgi:N-acetyl-anhydromuramyl-L-alanine amidase AmpD